MKVSYTRVIFDMSRLVRLRSEASVEKQSKILMENRGGGSALVSKNVKKRSTNLDMSKTTLVYENFMLKSYYVEAGRDQPGHK